MWWAYHIIALNKLVNSDENIVHSKTMMIAGEAAVFIILLFVGVYFIRRSILKELALVHEKVSSLEFLNPQRSFQDLMRFLAFQT